MNQKQIRISVRREVEDQRFEVRANQPPSGLHLNIWEIGKLNLRQGRWCMR